MKTIISTSQAPAAIGPYAQAVKANGFVITSGQLPIDPATGAFPEGIQAQTRQSLSNVKAILEEAGFSVEIAGNGRIALEMLRASHPGHYQLVLMDVQMPVMNGYEATQVIRKLEIRISPLSPFWL